jgi:hypothetical protein
MPDISNFFGAGATDALWAFFKAEVFLTVNIVVSLAAGEAILGLGIIDKLFRPAIPYLARFGIHGKIAAAMLMALGSPRSGAAIISGAYSDGEITRGEATFGTLSLAFPGYLKRWVGTAAMAAGIAGLAGLIFSAAIVARSAVRFIWVTLLLSRHGTSRTEGADVRPEALPWRARRGRVVRMLKKSLPWAWVFFALTYALVPFADRFFSERVAKWGFSAFMPAEGWAVAASSLAHVTAGLSAAAGAMKTGNLSVAQAVLALLVGNMVGSITRTMRQNVGYWVGIFPRDLIPGLLRWHLATNMTLEILSIFIAWFASGVSFIG